MNRSIHKYVRGAIINNCGMTMMSTAEIQILNKYIIVAVVIAI